MIEHLLRALLGITCPCCGARQRDLVRHYSTTHAPSFKHSCERETS